MPDDDEDEDGRDDFNDDNKGKASEGSSHWSANKLTPQKSIAKRRPGPGGLGTRRNGPIVPSGYSREPSANAKFGRRLVSPNSSADRPSIGGTSTSSVRRPAAPSNEGPSIKVRVTRPARDGKTRTPATTVQSTKCPHNIPQNSAATRTTTAPANKVLSSPATFEGTAVPVKNMPYPFPRFGPRESSEQEQIPFPPSPGLTNDGAEGDHEGKGEGEEEKEGEIVVEVDDDEEVESEQESSSREEPLSFSGRAFNSLSSLGQPISSRYPFAFRHPGRGRSISSTGSPAAGASGRQRAGTIQMSPTPAVALTAMRLALQQQQQDLGAESIGSGSDREDDDRTSRSDQPSPDGSLEAREREDSVGLLSPASSQSSPRVSFLGSSRSRNGSAASPARISGTFHLRSRSWHMSSGSGTGTGTGTGTGSGASSRHNSHVSL
jgi:hypothetical protein